jgi:hypothetical protein
VSVCTVYGWCALPNGHRGHHYSHTPRRLAGRLPPEHQFSRDGMAWAQDELDVLHVLARASTHWWESGL